MTLVFKWDEIIWGRKLLRMMKKRFVLMVMAAVAILSSIGICAASLKSTVIVEDSLEPVSTTPMDLFLGMDTDDDYSYTGSDSLLYWFPGLIKQEKSATWYSADDDYAMKFRCSLGMYIDKEYPSEAVFRKLEETIDTLLVGGLNCYSAIDGKPALRLLETHRPQNSQQMLDFGSQVFDMFTRQMKASKPESAYETVPEARVCLVGHKVYDQGNQATYLVEMSYDINGSCGCPSWAHFLTIDKNTGLVLKPDDVIKQYGAANLKRRLWDAYMAARQERGYGDLDGSEVSADDLLTEADGCAIINEGLMFYYLPYHIGCGAEGEYNLVLKMN